MTERELKSLKTAYGDLECAFKCIRGYSYGNALTKVNRARLIILNIINKYGKGKES